MKCPGQDPRFWKFDAIFDSQCANCGATVEFFKDETRRRCKKCGEYVLNPKMDFGCAAYCKFAKDCFGDLPPELIKQKEDLFKDRVAVEVKQHFKTDFRRIGHAAKVARHAERLVPEEKGDPAIVLTAAYLRDVALKGLPEDPAGADAQTYAELSAKLAREILTRLDAAPRLIDEVCGIIGHRDPGPDESVNFKLVYDADAIAKIERGLRAGPMDRASIEELIDSTLLTEGGRELARSLLLNGTQAKAVGA
jgi:hypothetical protein